MWQASKQLKLAALPFNFNPHVAHLSNFLKGQDTQALRKAVGALGQQHTLDSVLPPELRSRVKLVSMEAGCWLVYVDNGAIAAKLKQMTLTLVSRLQAKGQKIDSLRIKTAINTTPPKRAKQAHISSETLQHLRETVATMPDSPIRQAFIKLIRHHGFD